MKWEKLICAERQQAKEEKPKQFEQFDIDAFDDDFLSIISSQAFRRLQDKTQVFPLDKSDFVRTRLTHSMEVSAIARDLARMITQNTSPYLPEDFKKDPALGRRAAAIAACAGLLHDTGNPPFGHYGEEVIRDWFRVKFQDEGFKFRGRPIGELLRAADARMTADFENFEGNAQGLRILSKAGLREGSHDVNLTYAVINTLIKYPNPSTDFDRKSPDVKRHKVGYYYAEREVMDRVCTATGTKTDAGYVRHPLVYIMEAADDIAYATADLADAVKKGRFTVRAFIEFYEKELDAIVGECRAEELPSSARIARDQIELLKKAIRDDRTPELAAGKSAFCQTLAHSDTPETEFTIFENWLERVRMWLMYGAEFTFTKNYESIMEGTYQGDLTEGNNGTDLLRILKKAMVTFVFHSQELISLELSARRIVESLLNDFIHAVKYADEPDEREHLSTIDDRFLHMIPDNFKMDYLGAKKQVDARVAEGAQSEEDAEAEKLYLRFLMVTDFISGMTDSYAKNLYRIANGLD